MVALAIGIACVAGLGRSLAGFSKAQEDGVLVSYRCCNPYRTCSGLKKLKFIHSLTDLEGQRPRRVLRAMFLLETQGWVIPGLFQGPTDTCISGRTAPPSISGASD